MRGWEDTHRSEPVNDLNRQTPINTKYRRGHVKSFSWLAQLKRDSKTKQIKCRPRSKNMNLASDFKCKSNRSVGYPSIYLIFQNMNDRDKRPVDPLRQETLSCSRLQSSVAVTGVCFLYLLSDQLRCQDIIWNNIPPFLFGMKDESRLQALCSLFEQ